jgi:hypothetical protein
LREAWRVKGEGEGEGEGRKGKQFAVGCREIWRRLAKRGLTGAGGPLANFDCLGGGAGGYRGNGPGSSNESSPRQGKAARQPQD